MITKNENNLVMLLQHPLVKKNLDVRILSGLTGKTQIDYAIGIANTVVMDLERTNKVPEDLKKLYQIIKNDAKYRFYFSQPHASSLQGKCKNPTYKAINGF